MTAREEVTTLLETYLPPEVLVVPYARELDAVTKSTVLVRLDKVRPSTDANGWLTFEYALVLLASQTVAGPADDELEDLLLDVWFALEQASAAGITWTDATRAVYPPDNPTNPAFEVPISVTIQKESA